MAAREALRDAETARTAALQAQAEAEKRQREAVMGLEQKRREHYAQQLLDVAAIWQREPSKARQMLDDVSRCPSDLRDFAWGLLDSSSIRRPVSFRLNHKTCRRSPFRPTARSPRPAAMGQCACGIKRESNARSPATQNIKCMRWHFHRMASISPRLDPKIRCESGINQVGRTHLKSIVVIFAHWPILPMEKRWPLGITTAGFDSGTLLHWKKRKVRFKLHRRQFSRSSLARMENYWSQRQRLDYS